MEYKWSLRKIPDSDSIRHLISEINVSELVATLLVQRGIKTFEQARSFFRPNMEDLHDPFLLKDMDKAVLRLRKASSEKEKILVFGDYDVDGTTSVAMVYDFLKKRGLEVEFYVPDRYKEGYGISKKGIDFGVETGCTLMIALDCGVKAFEEVDYSIEKGLDVIVCDHHKSGIDVPNAVAVLDPQRDDCDYPFKGLSGCGVGFKFLQAYCREEGIEESVLHQYLDLLTVSIGADIVPVTGENRILAHFGLKMLCENPRPGLTCLLKHAGVTKKRLTISDAVFILAPRINAAGRIHWAGNAVKILIADSEEEADEFCSIVEENNRKRKELDKDITEQALQQFEEDPWLEDAWCTVVSGEDWHKGVIGIVASRLIENQYRPTIVFTQNKGKLTGSARSIEGVDIHTALEECSELIDQFGGHTMAAGLTVDPSNYEAFRVKFNDVVQRMLEGVRPVPVIDVDAELDFHGIDGRQYKILRQFEPFGPGNMKPLFLAKGVINAKWTRTVGADSSHLKLHVKQSDVQGPEMNGVAFKMGDRCGEILQGRSFDMVYTLEENEWKGVTKLEISAKDIKFDKVSALLCD